MSFESRYGTWLAFLLGSPNAEMTLPSACRPALMLIPSLARSPIADVRFSLSLPARSTKWNLLVRVTHSPSGSGSSGVNGANGDSDMMLARLSFDPGAWIPLVKGVGILECEPVDVRDAEDPEVVIPLDGYPVRLGLLTCLLKVGELRPSDARAAVVEAERGTGGGWAGTNFSWRRVILKMACERDDFSFISVE